MASTVHSESRAFQHWASFSSSKCLATPGKDDLSLTETLHIHVGKGQDDQETKEISYLEKGSLRASPQVQ